VRRRQVLGALGALALPWVFTSRAPQAHAAGVPVGETARASAAIRLAALAERIAKLHAQLGCGVLVERSRRALPEAAREFAVSLRSQLARTTVPEARENLQLLALLWDDHHAWAVKAPTREHARKLGERTEEVVWVAMKTARLVQALASDGAGAPALQAAEACVLSQRIPRLYLWRQWGIRDPGPLDELRASEARLRAILEALHAASSRSPQLAAELDVAQNQAVFLAHAAQRLQGGDDAARHLEFVAKTGDHIFESMQRLVRLHEGA
jgi:hypothetical protein